MGVMNPFVEQNYYRLRNDANSPDGGTPSWITDENQTTREVISTGALFRVRFVMSNSGDATQGDTFQLFYSHEGGTYTQVTNASSVVQTADVYAGGDSVTITTANFLLTPGSGTALNGYFRDNAAYEITPNMGAPQYWELEWGITIVNADVNDADTIDLRVYVGGAELDQYDANSTPIIEVSKAAAVGRSRSYIIQ